MKDETKEIKFIEYNGIEGYIELMKHDVEPLNNPEVKNIELYYSGKDIKAVLDYITNLEQENENKDNKILELQQELLNKKLNIKDIEYKEKMLYKLRNEKALDKLYCYGEVFDSKILQQFQKEMENILTGGDEE